MFNLSACHSHGRPDREAKTPVATQPALLVLVFETSVRDLELEEAMNWEKIRLENHLHLSSSAMTPW
jgi:hypothetical protein